MKTVTAYYYYSRLDICAEPISKTLSLGRLAAAQYFASRKRLPLKEFLKIWAVSKK